MLLLMTKGEFARRFDYRQRDRVLALLPTETPRSFNRLPFREQQWRGRAWILIWGAGLDESFAWARALSAEEPWQSNLKSRVDFVIEASGDKAWPEMI